MANAFTSETLRVVRDQMADAWADGWIEGPYDPPEASDADLAEAIESAVELGVDGVEAGAIVAYLLLGPDERGEFRLVAA